MSPENTQLKLMGFYMEGLILGVNTMYMLFCFFKLFLIGCIGLLIVEISAWCSRSRSSTTCEIGKADICTDQVF